MNKLILNLKELDNALTFRILEIGALNLGKKEKFYDLLNYFPNSEIIGFEVDKNICKKMNSVSKVGVKYFPFAIGKKKKLENFMRRIIQCAHLYINQIIISSRFIIIWKFLSLKERVKLKLLT